MGRFDGKSVVVTGAASGIGEATARGIVEQGGRVVIADLQHAVTQPQTFHCQLAECERPR